VCADPHIASGAEFRHLLKLIADSGVETMVFSDIVPELPTPEVEQAVRHAREFGADVVVTIGGGSSIDLGKLVALLLAHGGSVSDYYGEFKVPGPTLPVLAVPTTAGTGSEATPVAVVTDAERGSKVGVSSPYLIPAIAICDPELTYSCPPSVTASAGTDALAHCIEAYTAVRRQPHAGLANERVFVGRTPMTDALALSGIRHIVAGLQRSFADPSDRKARSDVMFGALMAGLAFGTAGTAAAHALQYPVGALTHTPHGVGVGVLLPYVMEFNRRKRVPELAEIGRAFGAAGSDEDAARQAPELVAAYLEVIGIPRSVRDLGVTEEQLAWTAGEAPKAVRLSENNPEPLTEDGARRILDASYAGDLSLVNDADRRTGSPV
jgi:alcohol dehydrogenase